MNPNMGKEGVATRFTHTRRPKNPGRKPSMLKKYIKQNSVGIDDQVAIFEEIICNYTAIEIKTMVGSCVDPKGKPLSGLVWGFLIAWLADNKRGWSNGGINTYFRDRRFGKTPDKLISMTEDLTRLTPEERDAEIERLYQDHKNQVRGRGDAGAGQPDGAPGEPEKIVETEPDKTEEPNNQ